MSANAIKMNIRDDVKKIREDYGWDLNYISSRLDIKENTLEDILYRNKETNITSKSKTIRVHFLRVFLDKINDSGDFPTPKLVSSIPVMSGRDFFSFVREFYKKENELILYIIETSIKDFISNKIDIDYIQEFKKKFEGVINDETLTLAVKENPEFLANFINHGKVKNLTKALAVAKLGLIANDNYLGMIKSFTKDNSPLVREGAYKALAEYFIEDPEKHQDLYKFFKNALNEKDGEGVKRQIKSLLDVMEMYI